MVLGENRKGALSSPSRALEGYKKVEAGPQVECLEGWMVKDRGAGYQRSAIIQKQPAGGIQFNKIVACTSVQGTRTCRAGVCSRGRILETRRGSKPKAREDRFQFSGRLSVHARG